MTMPLPAQARTADRLRPLSEAIAHAARHYGIQIAPEQLHARVLWVRPADDRAALALLSETAGLTARKVRLSRSALSGNGALIVVDGKAGWTVITPGPKGRVHLRIWADGTQTDHEAATAEVAKQLDGTVFVLAPGNAHRNKRIAELLEPEPGAWFRQIVRASRGPMGELALASFVSNTLALAASLFSMQVYDRVIPSQSLPTLWVLAVGAGIALILDFLLRVMRGAVADHFGKRADMRMSRLLFSHMLDIRSDARPRSSGALVAQLRDMEQLRELLTSTNLGVMLDLPFAFLFLGLIAFIGGWMVAVPLAAIPLIVVPGLLLQVPLARLSRQGNAESALRNALLMESVSRADDIKSIQAEEKVLADWITAARTSGQIGLKQRFLKSLLMSWSQFIQQLAYVGVIASGAYGVFYGGLSFGALIACSTLTSRTIAPLGQLAAVFAALQNARVGKASLDRLMALPTDHGPATERFHRPTLRGRYQIENLVYSYEADGKPSLFVPQLMIESGEKIGIIGRAGAGKTTLLRLLAGLSRPTGGRIMLDGTDVGSIDQADLRRNMGVLLQGFDLFYGTIRDNLLMAAPGATDEQLLDAMRISGAQYLLAHNAQGLDLKIFENGVGLSGGQRQALLLARTLLRDAPIVILDEPTEAIDDGTEQRIIANLRQAMTGKTLFVSTHRGQLLELVDRLIVVDAGRIVLSGPKHEVLERLRAGPGQNTKTMRLG